MRLSSPRFGPNGEIPARFTCQGENINPPLMIDGVPEQTAVLALVIDDPDAPGGTFDHWVMWNLPPTLREIPEHWQPGPDVKVGNNGFGKQNYDGPCPPSGMHHYRFRLYALDGMLDLAAGSSHQDLDRAMAGHIVAQAELVGIYAKH